jgi:hypothetical protein
MPYIVCGMGTLHNIIVMHGHIHILISSGSVSMYSMANNWYKMTVGSSLTSHIVLYKLCAKKIHTTKLFNQ